MDLTFADMALLLAFLLAVGVFAGVLAGLLGVGGGIVIVPSLFYVFIALDYPPETLMHVCVATSLATIVLTSMRSVLAHHRKGAVDWPLLRGWAPWIALGAVLAVLVADRLKSGSLMVVFGGVAFIVALHMAFGRSAWRLADAPPTGAARAGVATSVGFLSVLMGIGGGTFGVPLLTLFNLAVHRAVATAAGFGLIIAIPSTIGFIASGWDAPNLPPFTLGYVSMPAFAIIVPMTVLCAPYGVKLAHSMNPRPLRLLFAFFLAATALNMLRKAVYG
ncbi:sulfite exporter TauE/SafE family protein [Pikeienuella sp. HZG-20]|uniref:sulfite exporter TauE/SafE family protein n=1 Tax=Paludibacillus litoralis TaxID=3133267 RepID=UPI0030EDB2B5